MKRFCSTVLLLLGLIGGIEAQVFYSVSVDKDSVLLGNSLQVKFQAEGLEGKIHLPDMNDLPVIGGPNVSRQMSIVNGEYSISQSTTIELMPDHIGEIVIGPSEFVAKDTTIMVDSMVIRVVPNPDNILQESSFPGDDFQRGHFEVFGKRPKAREGKSKLSKRKMKRF